MRAWGFLLLLVIVSVAGWLLFWPRTTVVHVPPPVPAATPNTLASPVIATNTPGPPAVARATTSVASGGQPTPQDQPPAPLSPAAAAALPPPKPGGLAPWTVLENMRTTIRQFASTFGGNPVGNNAEITKALTGDNPRHTNFLKEDGNTLDDNGQLIDPWGTPYFFHQLAAREMEIRSAGPDKVMWTADDLVIK